MLRHVNRAGSTFWIENDPLPFFWTFPKIHPIWRSHTSLKIKSLQTSNKALQTWSRIKSKGANWCPKQRCECILHHFALPHGLLQGNCEKARSEYIYCKDNCILIELQKSWNPPEVPSSINLAASQGSTSPSFLGNKDTPRSTNDLQSHTLTAFIVMILGSQAVKNCQQCRRSQCMMTTRTKKIRNRTTHWAFIAG